MQKGRTIHLALWGPVEWLTIDSHDSIPLEFWRCEALVLMREELDDSTTFHTTGCSVEDDAFSDNCHVIMITL